MRNGIADITSSQLRHVQQRDKNIAYRVVDLKKAV